MLPASSDKVQGSSDVRTGCAVGNKTQILSSPSSSSSIADYQPLPSEPRLSLIDKLKSSSGIDFPFLLHDFASGKIEDAPPFTILSARPFGC
jgi:hypothetical protein